MKLIGMLFDAFLGDALSNAYDKVQQAQKQLARCISEEQFHHEMCVFYRARVENINPYNNSHEAQRFTDALSKFEEHCADAAHWADRVADARQVLALRTEQHDALLGDVR